MAKVQIAGNSYVVVSAVAQADLELVQKYRPSALKITDPDTGNTIFKVEVGPGCQSAHGISFDGVSNCEGKFATATFSMPPNIEDAKEHVLEAAGPALIQLKTIEAALPAVLDEIRTLHNDIKQSIIIVA